jgi:putative transferase (TIGR04331 family)
MKYNFIVSDYRKLWIKGSARLFIVDPFVYFQLKKDGHIIDYDDVEVAPYRRQSSGDLEKDHNFVQHKFDKYVYILADRLNQIHNTSYNIPFWRKALSLSLERYITFLHDSFENCELYFNVNKHECYVLSKKSYYTPLDFDGQRNFFQHSHYGQEQIFSIYMHTFYPDGLKTKDDQFKTKIKSSFKKPLFLRLLKQGFSRATFEKVKQRLLEKYYSRKAHRIGIMGSFFSARYLNFLMIKSKGSIYPIKWNMELKGGDTLLSDERKFLSVKQRDLDKFDRFFFASVEYCLPKIFVEYFKKVEQYYVNCFNKYKHLKFITSEAWLSSNILCIALALLKERGIKHIYNEHNYLEHIWVGNLINKEVILSDIFVSIGWHSNEIPNMIKGASLFEFGMDKRPKKKYTISYISDIPSAKRPHYTASYGTLCENTPKYYEFVLLFFSSLSYKTRREILFKGRPISNSGNRLHYDHEFMLAPYLKHVKKFVNTAVSAKTLMLQSNLVIVDYISTSYLESLIMNIPTIFFWNPDAYYLSEDYSDFFDPLISVGICQTDPVKAAHFVESVKDDPEKWWMQETVKKAKDDFLRKNIGKPEVMINYLLGLLKSDDYLTSNPKKDVA